MGSGVVGDARADALIDAAAPPSWGPPQRAALRDAVRAKMASLQAHLQQGGSLWRLRGQPEQLEEWFGEETFVRLAEMALFVRMGGRSLRTTLEVT